MIFYYFPIKLLYFLQQNLRRTLFSMCTILLSSCIICYNKLMDANTIIVILAIILGRILLFGLYKLATSNISQRSILKPDTAVAKRRQTIKTFLTIFFSILLLLALYVTWELIAL